MLKMIPGARYAPIVGANAAVAHPDAKRQMHVETGAAVVDMESHLVARFASTHGLSFAAVRVVIDPAHRVVPEAALSGMRPDGGTSVTAVILDLIARPSQFRPAPRNSRCLCGAPRLAPRKPDARPGLRLSRSRRGLAWPERHVRNSSIHSARRRLNLNLRAVSGFVRSTA